MKDIRLDPIEYDHIKGINCSAKNCKYNEEECYCTAEKINVGTSGAHCVSDTVCGTFRPRSE